VRTVTNAGWNVGALAVSMAVLFVATPITVRLLGTDRYGLWALLTAVLAPLTVANLGVGQATVKLVAEEIGAGRPDQAGPYIRTSALYSIAIGLGGWLVLVLLSGTIVERVFRIAPQDYGLAARCVVWVGATWALSQAASVYAAVPAALQRYSLVSAGSTANVVATAVVGVTVLSLGGDLVAFLQSQAAVQALALAFWVTLARRLMPSLSVVPGWHTSAFRRTLDFGIWQTISNGLGIVAGQADKYVLGVMLPTAAVGLYNIAQTLQVRAYLLVWKMAEVLFPAFSHMQGEGDRTRESRALLRATWLLSTLSVLVLGPLVVWAHDFLRLWMGADVAAGASGVLRVLALAGVIGSSVNASYFYLLGTGRTRWVAAMSLVNTIGVVCGSIALVPRLGLAGAGWGVLAGSLAQVVVTTVAWSRIFRGEVSLRSQLATFYGPVVVGALVAEALTQLRLAVVLEVGWARLLAGVAASDIVLAVCVVGSSWLLLSRDQRQEDVAWATSLLRSALARLTRRSGKAPSNRGLR